MVLDEGLPSLAQDAGGSVGIVQECVKFSSTGEEFPCFFLEIPHVFFLDMPLTPGR